jgi:hypothetical protein
MDAAAHAAPAGPPPASSSPAPLHLAQRIASALTALVGPARGDARTRAIGRLRSRSIARVTVIGSPD